MQKTVFAFFLKWAVTCCFLVFLAPRKIYKGQCLFYTCSKREEILFFRQKVMLFYCMQKTLLAFLL